MTSPFPFLTRNRQKSRSTPQSTLATREKIIPQEESFRVHETTRRDLESSGLFDAAFYKATYQDVADAAIDPFEHFFFHGYKEGRKPNAVFDPSWYVGAHADVRDSGEQPLLHYARIGEREGRRPGPYFDPAWYRERYELGEDESPLAHYLKNRFGPFSPIPEFDSEFYLKAYPDVLAAKIDPFEHFLHFGYREGRNPSAEFDTRFYVQRYLKGSLDQNPLLHYLQHAHLQGYYTKAPEDEATIPAEVKRFTKPGVHFEEAAPLPASSPRRAKILAYYLTQFHAIPENDRWWGKGFTEWTNLARGLPRFKDHFQPRIPRDLGFYSLGDIDVMRRQVELAKGAGVHGFVFYYYWFNGKRLLEKPLEQFLAARDIDMPFCLMWANENWTRRWDGMESEVLIAQSYLANDDEALVAEYVRHFSDPRYIRIDGRPLLMIYRPRLIPDTKATIARWRRLFEKFGEEPIIIMSQAFDDFDPRPFGLDGAIEFPPHKTTRDMAPVNAEVSLLDDTFSGQVYRYDDVVAFSLEEKTPEFPLIKTLVPGWDNDARRQGRGLVIHGSTPAKYEAWLSALIERARKETFHGEAIVCVNAWNEWCEGAYLEPDLHFGSAYLNATARAVVGLTSDVSRPRVLLVGHDAFPSGAQHLLLNIGRTLRGAFGVDIEYLLLAGGQLEDEYREVAPLSIATDLKDLAAKVRGYRERGFRSAICNTTATGRAVSALAEGGVRTVLLVHELPRILREKGLEEVAGAAISAADQVLFPSRYVRDEVLGALELEDDARIEVRPQGSYKQVAPSEEGRARVRRELGIPDDEHLVLGVGYADIRKGFDLFHQTWRLLQPGRPRVHFCWVGGIDPALSDWLGREISAARSVGTFHMVGYRPDVEDFFAAADAFILSSREDPFPTVALEAMSAGVPVLAFENTGGIPEFLKEREIGHVVPYGDVPAIAMKLKKVLGTADRALLERASEVVATEFAFPAYVRDLLRMAEPQLASVSVAVPNYNYAHCLKDRLGTIFDQTHPVEEVIVLDDASSDTSVDVIVEAAEARQRDVTLIINEANSGSVFAQWRRAAELATGEFLWIAEADDLSEPTFLSSMLALMRTDASIELGFSDSRSIDADGHPVFASYKPYYASIEPDALTRSEIFRGQDFVARFLGVKNTILNVSSVLWRRSALLAALDACREDLKTFRMAGDWRIYLEMLAKPDAKIAYLADPLNVHRRHAQSVTHSLKTQQHLHEIELSQDIARRRFRLPEATLKAQQAYLSEVSDQLQAVNPAPALKVKAKRTAPQPVAAALSEPPRVRSPEPRAKASVFRAR